MYGILAFGLIGLSINRYPRLSQSPRWMWIGRVMAVVGLAGSASVYAYTERSKLDVDAYRSKLLEAHVSLTRPSAVVSHYTFDVDLLDRSPLAARVIVSLSNPQDVRLDTLTFSLNPGLRVSDVSIGSVVAVFAQEGPFVHVIHPLDAGDSAAVEFDYAGDVDIEAFDLRKSETRLRKSRHPFYKGDMTAWIESRSVFLPPRSKWYPTPGPDYREDVRPSYATATLKVSVPEDLTVVTQGVTTDSYQSEGRLTTVWNVETAVPVYSLNAGVYEVFETRVHEIDMALYLHPAHTRQVTFFAEAQEGVLEALDQIIDVMEQETALPYPFPRLSIVEVPFQIQWYYEGWEEQGGLVQPGILMVEEDVLMGKRFKRDMDRRKRFSRGGMWISSRSSGTCSCPPFSSCSLARRRVEADCSAAPSSNFGRSIDPSPANNRHSSSEVFLCSSNRM